MRVNILMLLTCYVFVVNLKCMPLNDVLCIYITYFFTRSILSLCEGHSRLAIVVIDQIFQILLPSINILDLHFLKFFTGYLNCVINYG